MSTIGSRPRTPLVTINWTQIAIFIGPFVPNRNLVIVQILDVRIALQKPQQLVNDTAQVEFLGREAREALGKVKAGLATKHRTGASASAVRAIHTVIDNIFKKV